MHAVLTRDQLQRLPGIHHPAVHHEARAAGEPLDDELRRALSEQAFPLAGEGLVAALIREVGAAGLPAGLEGHGVDPWTQHALAGQLHQVGLRLLQPLPLGRGPGPEDRGPLEHERSVQIRPVGVSPQELQRGAGLSEAPGDVLLDVEGLPAPQALGLHAPQGQHGLLCAVECVYLDGPGQLRHTQVGGGAGAALGLLELSLGRELPQPLHAGGVGGSGEEPGEEGQGCREGHGSLARR